MKIALVSYEYEPEIGGIGTYVNQTAFALVRRGHAVHVVCPDYGNPAALSSGDQPKRLRQDEVTKGTAHVGAGVAQTGPVVWRFPGRRRLGAPASVLYSAWRLGSILRSLRADWIVLLDLNAEVQVGLLGRCGLALGSDSLAAVFHGSELHHLKVGKVARSFGVPALDRCAVLFANSLDTMGRVERLSPPSWLAKTVHAGIGVSPEFLESPRDPASEAALRAQFGIGEGTFVLLTVARLAARKGIDRSLEAMARLEPATRARCCYLIVGTGSLRSELEGHAVRLGIMDSVRFCGAVAASQLPRFYDVASVYLQLSRGVSGDVEGLGISYLEAAARGVPSVGFHHGGVPEAVESGVTGTLVDEDDVGAACAALAQLLGDDALRTKMGEAARARVVALFRWELVAARIEEALMSPPLHPSQRGDHTERPGSPRPASSKGARPEPGTER